VRTAYARIFLIGLALQVVLQRYPQGILPERRPGTDRATTREPEATGEHA
jgi:branched-chain amino acid transport system permease protein